MTPLEWVRVWLAFFLEFPRANRFECWLQGKLLKLAAAVTVLRGHQTRHHWWVLAPGWQWLRLWIIRSAFGVGLIHASFTFIDNQQGSSNGATTVDCSDGAMNVAAGDVLVVWVKHEGAPTTIAVADTGGGNSFTFDAGDKVDHSNNDLSGQFGYVLSAAADATFVGRVTLGAARTFITIQVWQFRPDAGETVSKDGSNTGQGNGTSMASGAINTAGDDVIMLGGYSEYVANNSSAHQLNGVNATGVLQASAMGSNFTASWYRILAATTTGATATCSNSSSDWICNIIAIKSAAAGGGGRYAHRQILSGVG